VRILTSALLGVLTDLAHTADRTPDAGLTGSVLLHTGRGHHGGEPGIMELLAGASTDRRVAGHTYAPCSGQLTQPTLWSLRDVKSVITVFKAARGRDPLNIHAVEIARSDGEVTIREDPNLIDEGVSLSFGELDPFDYPARTLYDVLDTPPCPDVVLGVGRLAELSLRPPTPRTDLIPSSLVPFTRVAVRRGELIRLYRRHQHRPLLIQIGDTYRGLLLPWRPIERVLGDEDHPDAELLAPDLSDERWWHHRHAGGEPAGESAGEPWEQLAMSDLDHLDRDQGDEDDDLHDEEEDGPP
jgi:S-DNA-T family DNA segregation ATPase FtsK/SpoIIIE